MRSHRTALLTGLVVACVAAVGLAPAQAAVYPDIRVLDTPDSVVGGHWVYSTDKPEEEVFWGETIVLNAAPGFFTSGPEGDWPGGAESRAYAGYDLLGPFSKVEINGYGGEEGGRFAVEVSVSADGGQLRVTLPDVVPGGLPWATQGGALTISGNEQCSLGTLGWTCTGDWFTVTLPLVFEELEHERIAGADRFETAVKVSQQQFPFGSRRVFLATGFNYPDALAAGPAAAEVSGPLLLTAGDHVPDSVAAELERLEPLEIIILGNTSAISSAVQAEAATIADTVTRIQGADRYATARAVVEEFFSDEGAHSAYVVTGQNFPDALSAGAIGARQGRPIILVNGGASAVDTATLALMHDLGVEIVTIVGGPTTVSAGIQSQLVSEFTTVTRIAGADRFETSALLNRDAYPTAQAAVLATGMNFPDALAGASLALYDDAPLFTVQESCVPASVHETLGVLDVTTVTLLGGTPTLSPAVESLAHC